MWRQLISGAIAVALHLPVATALAQSNPQPSSESEIKEEFVDPALASEMRLYGIAENLTERMREFLGKIETEEEQSDNPPKNLKVRLTLNDPSDLKVYQGSFLAPGDLIAERTSDRARLEAQLNQLKLSSSRLSALSVPQPKMPKVTELPPIFYAESQAAIASRDCCIVRREPGARARR